MRNRNEGGEYFENESRRIDEALKKSEEQEHQNPSWVVAVTDKTSIFFHKHCKMPNALFLGFDTWLDIQNQQMHNLKKCESNSKWTFIGLEIKIINAPNGYYVGLL